MFLILLKTTFRFSSMHKIYQKILKHLSFWKQFRKNFILFFASTRCCRIKNYYMWYVLKYYISSYTPITFKYSVNSNHNNEMQEFFFWGGVRKSWFRVTQRIIFTVCFYLTFFHLGFLTLTTFSVKWVFLQKSKVMKMKKKLLTVSGPNWQKFVGPDCN